MARLQSFFVAFVAVFHVFEQFIDHYLLALDHFRVLVVVPATAWGPIVGRVGVRVLYCVSCRARVSLCFLALHIYQQLVEASSARLARGSRLMPWNLLL